MQSAKLNQLKIMEAQSREKAMALAKADAEKKLRMQQREDGKQLTDGSFESQFAKVTGVSAPSLPSVSLPSVSLPSF